ncbi:MAG: 1-acyl-sn-glycerol-3-phosphate acyltransferase [Myxococcota bacterium]
MAQATGTATDPTGTPAAVPVEADPYTSMAPRFGRLARAFGERFFSGMRFDPAELDTLRAIEADGAVVYVMRYSSRLDYLLFNWLFLASDVRLSSLANGIRFYYYRPIGEALRLLVRGLFDRVRLGRRGMRARQIQRMRQILRDGGSLFLFLRTAKMGQELRSRRGRIASGQSELDYLREIVDACFDEPIRVSLVPLALFWRRGTRPDRRYLNVFYGAPARPTDTGKMISFLWNYRSLAVRVGTPIDLRAFVDQRGDQGRVRVVKQVRRAVMIFLRREEKPVAGPALRLLDKVEEVVLGDPEVQRAIEEAASGRASRARAEARARRLLRQIAARQNGTALAILDLIVGWMFERLFGRVEVHGLERTIEAAKLHPLIMVPSHRSHFDYLILSWLFYEHHLVPPHVAAGINLAFWPLGPILRRAGAFFLRRSFDGDRLYAAVFRSYVRMLIKDGATQEFFIEGTRSRTGKTLRPRLGMLGMIVEAFARGVRRDVFLVPVGFTYERLVEEGAISEERKGAQKKGESLLALLRARRIFRHRFGSVVVRFGEPISLAQALGPDRGEADSGDPLQLAERKRVTERLGYQLCRRINDLVTAGRSAVSSAALLAYPGEGVRENEFCRRVEETVGILRLLGMPLSDALERALERDHPEAALDLLLQSGLVERRVSRTGDLLHFKREVRDRLDLYRATLMPRLIWASVLALGLRGGGSRKEVLESANSTLELLRLEYFPPEAVEERWARFERLLGHFGRRGWLREAEGDSLELGDAGLHWVGYLAAQPAPLVEAYGACFLLVEALEGSGRQRELIDATLTSLREQLMLGEAHHPEAIAPTTIANALALLLAEKVLVCEGNPNQATAIFRPGPRWSHLSELRHLVARALGSR